MSSNQLKNAFHQFSLETERVENLYHSIQEQYRSIQLSLQDTHTKFEGKLAELDFTTRYLDAILQHISQGLLFIDLNGMVTTYNQAAEDIFGKKSSATLFRTVWESFSDDCFGFSLKEALRTKECPKVSYVTWSIPDSAKLDLEVELTFVESQHQTSQRQSTPHMIKGLLILVRNITEIRKLQQIANRHDRLKDLGELAARLAHEIRNPLGSIIGFANLLQSDLKDKPDQQHIASLIVEGTQGLNQLVSSILNYSRTLQVNLEDIDLVDLMNEMIQQIQGDPAFHSTIQCQIQCNEEHLNVPADLSLFKSAILNLLVNALEAMPSGGELNIELYKNAKFAIIKIRDSGIGIPDEYKDKVFSPFFTTKATGNGFGLSEVYKIVQAHNGTIEVESVTGEGTQFIIQLPLR